MKHKAEVVKITPEMAEQWLRDHNFERQRKINPQHVKFLADCLGKGAFDGGAPIRFANLKRRLIIIDGQHRLDVISRGSSAVDVVVVTTECETIEGVAELYSRIDRGRSRSLSDVLKAFSDYAENGLTPTQAAITSSAAVIVEAGFPASPPNGSRYAVKSAEHRHELAIAYSREASKFFAAIANGDLFNCKALQRQASLAVALALYGSNTPAESIDAFFGGAAKDDGLRAGDPRKQLLKFLFRHKGSQDVGTIARGVATCWNAWYRSKELTMVRAGDAAVEINIIGTRFSAHSVARRAEAAVSEAHA